MLKIGLTAESAQDAAVVRGLGDAVAVEAAPWIDGQLDVFREWRGIEGEYLDLHHATRLAQARGVRTFGHFQGEPGELDAQLYRNVLSLFADQEDPCDVVVIARNTDEDLGRIEGFRRAAQDRAWGFVPVQAAAHPEIEAWLLSAFLPRDDEERGRLAALRAALGFDPTVDAHRLRSGDGTAKRDATRVLAALLDGEARARLLETPLDTLRQRGVSSRLTDFLVELRAAVAAALGAAP